ncbi:hypothetical protein GDO78_020611 [Eleutherodactylus coqui]|uniref:Uncharacterized protein n=1 Tax=Eleutherodactylus coqui TaxID=57060 RepID=A0A8J6C234_ELECQ|nr:hypothetical protein GDO78_020611 [Eleutherodactylus coqui]
MAGSPGRRSCQTPSAASWCPRRVTAAGCCSPRRTAATWAAPRTASAASRRPCRPPRSGASTWPCTRRSPSTASPASGTRGSGRRARSCRWSGTCRGGWTPSSRCSSRTAATASRAPTTACWPWTAA